jgi:hypothetical protein
MMNPADAVPSPVVVEASLVVEPVEPEVEDDVDPVVVDDVVSSAPSVAFPSPDAPPQATKRSADPRMRATR